VTLSDITQTGQFGKNWIDGFKMDSFWQKNEDPWVKGLDVHAPLSSIQQKRPARWWE